MYNAIILLLLGVTALLILLGITKQRKAIIAGGIGFGIFTILFFGFLSFWGDYLWFENLDYGTRFWAEILYKLGFLAVGLVLGLLITALIIYPLPAQLKISKLWPIGIGGVISASLGWNQWEMILKFLFQKNAGVTEPIFSNDAGFYMFSLPFLDHLYYWMMLLLLVGLITALFATFARIQSNNNMTFQLPVVHEKVKAQLYNAVFLNLGLLLLVFAFGKYLNIYHLLFSERGAVTGAGWTDVHVQLPAYYIVSGITAICGLILMFPPLRNRIAEWSRRFSPNPDLFILQPMAIILLAVWLLGLALLPNFFQWLRVEPNEITFEKPYITNNIKLTRFGYGLDQVEEREYPVEDSFSRGMVNQNKKLFDNIRRWDWRALDAVYKQFQEIRLYYEFKDIDIDRYQINDRYRQMMVSAREMETSNLPDQSETFVNKRFKYTHGYGITMTDVSDFTSEGLPNMLIKDIPPKSQYKDLQVTQPQIYYGEQTDEHVISNSKEQEFDYPKGDENSYNRYDGSGGVQLSNIWRQLIYGWKFDGSQLLLSDYPTDESRIMFNRNVRERVETLAPFVHWDQDPYVVLNEGKLYWIIDGYTTSDNMPYSKEFSGYETIDYQEGERKRALNNVISPQFRGSNYVRNSVKAVVNAHEGEVNLYQYDEEDPIINLWDDIFPNLIQPKSNMPQALQDHVRYPVDLLMAQGHIYSKYHMTDPNVFYNQEDLWTRATEKYHSKIQPVDPYYVMWELPKSNEPEFTLMMPFTPKNRQVAIGWIAGLCDGENYGRFLAYKFPKEKRTLGPQQVETKIDQDSYLSQKLALWNQRGSNVIRGNVLAIPIDNTLLYVEPIYLQSETAAYPEMRLVVTMVNDNISYAETFDKALAGLIKGQPPAKTDTATTRAREAMAKGQKQLIEQAKNAFNNYLDLTGKKEFNKASKALDELEKSLKQLSIPKEDTVNTSNQK